MNDCAVRYCCICGKRFEPHPRVGGHQRTCGGADCQKQRRRSNTRTWRAQHPECDDALCRRARQGDRQAYRRGYWATHPKARQHHAAYMRQWRTRRKTSVATRVRYPYRDIQDKLPAVNTYLQVMDVREANRVITAKLLSAQEFISFTTA
jgi:hypothetical protein